MIIGNVLTGTSPTAVILGENCEVSILNVLDANNRSCIGDEGFFF